MDEAIVFYPAPLLGHLVSIVEVCKLILTHQPSLSIHILISTPPYDTTTTLNYISTISTTLPSITFHTLPTYTPPKTLFASTLNHETLLFSILPHNTPHIHQTLISISKTHTIQALILDLLCSQDIFIASQHNLPAYIYSVTSASLVATHLYHPTLHETYDKSLKELNTYLNIPGVPPMPTWDMPKPSQDRNDEAYKNIQNCSLAAPKAAGYIINTFEALEPRSTKAISNGLCLPNSPTPPLYCVGPIITTTNDQKHSDHECLRWLDTQPNKSVIFLCFGSLGLFSKEQLHEIAIGLEKSGQRFLWVVRNPNPISDQKQNVALGLQEDPNLDSLLPTSFLERTKEKGILIKKWAPQVEVLKHDSVGGFVSHYGWNSVIESVSAGVPMIAWPLYAEQRFNRVVLVNEIEVALWMHESESGFVAASEVEERVRELMESENGKRVRDRVRVLKDEAKAAVRDDGASRVALDKLLKSWKTKESQESVKPMKSSFT